MIRIAREAAQDGQIAAKPKAIAQFMTAPVESTLLSVVPLELAAKQPKVIKRKPTDSTGSRAPITRVPKPAHQSVSEVRKTHDVVKPPTKIEKAHVKPLQTQEVQRAPSENFVEQTVAAAVYSATETASRDQVISKTPVVVRRFETKQTPGWTAELFYNESNELPSPEQMQVEIVPAVAEVTGMSEETAESATVFLATMPEQTQNDLKAYMEHATPEAQVQVEIMTVAIAEVADRLHVLAVEGSLDGEEAQQIIEWLAVKYEELLQAIGAEYTPATIQEFIELVTSDKYELQYDTFRELQHRQDLANAIPNVAHFTQNSELIMFTGRTGLASAA